MSWRSSLTNPGSDEEIDDEIGETLEVEPAVLDEAFSRAITKGGTAYLDKLELMVINDSELENEVNDIIESFSFLKSFIGDGGEHANKLSLTDLEDFGVTSARVRHRIGLLAFLMGNRSPSTSARNRRESSLSGVQSQASGSGEYEDDFEAIDDADESPRVRLRKLQRANASVSGNSSSLEGSYKSGGDYNPSNILSSKSEDGAAARSERKPSYGSDEGLQSDTNYEDENEVENENEDYTVEYDDDDDDVDLGTGGVGGEKEDEHPSRRRLVDRAPTAPQQHGRGGGGGMDMDRERVGQSVDGGPGSGADGRGSSSSSSSSNNNRNEREDERRASTAGAALAGERRKRRSRAKVASWIRDKKWSLGEKIGSGSFGEVYQGMNDLGRLFAVKQLHIAGQRNVVDELANEIQLMRDYAHPNVVGYLGADVDEAQGVVNIFQEWVPGGSLAHLLKRFGCFNEHVVANYSRQIVSGLAFLHANGIIHRDIKGGNVLVDESGSVKLADFGASTRVNPAFDKTQETASFKGTPYFMAPEVLGHGRYGRKGDVWAVGCTMIQMLTGQPPWKDRNLTGLVQLHILLSEWEGPPVYPEDKVSQECRDCIRACFAKDEASRPSAKQLLEAAFLQTDTASLEDSGRIIESFERKRLGSDAREGDAAAAGAGTGAGAGAGAGEGEGRGSPDANASSGSIDPLEDSGIAQMASLREQIARLAQSTESLPMAEAGAGAGAGGGRHISPRDREDDSVEAVQRQIERRRAVKKAVDLSRRKERGEGEGEGEGQTDALLSPSSGSANGGGIGIGIGMGMGMGSNPGAGIRVNTGRPQAGVMGGGRASRLVVRNPPLDGGATPRTAGAEEEQEEGVSPGSSNSNSSSRRSNPYARGAGTQRIGAGANRTPRGALGTPPHAAVGAGPGPGAGAGAGGVPPLHSPPAPAPAPALQEKEGTRVDARLARNSSTAARHQRARGTGAGTGAGTGTGNVSSARDSEGLTPGEEPESPFAADASPSPSPSPSPGAGAGVPVKYDALGREVWTCLACGEGNTEPSYCARCSVVRGSTGRSKGLTASVVRR